MPVWAPIRDDGLTYTASGTDFEAEWQPAPDTSGDCVRFRATATTSPDDWAQIAWAGANTFLAGYQLVLQAHGDIQPFLDSCAVELRGPSATTRIFDPANPDLPAAPPLIIDLANGFKLIAFDLAIELADAESTYDALRLIWTAAAPATDTDLFIAGVFGGGRIAGGAQAAAAYRCSGSLAESAGVLARDMGGRNTRLLGVFDPRNAAPLPVTPLLDYSLRVSAPQPADSATAQGVDHIDLYLDLYSDTLQTFSALSGSGSGSGSGSTSAAADPAAPTYRASFQTATYGASWGATGGRSEGESITVVLNDPVGPGARAGVGNRALPGPHCIPCPPAAALMPSGGRLIAAAPRLDGSQQTGSVACSEYGEPIRFASVSDFGRAGGAAWCETASDSVIALLPFDEQVESRAPVPILMLSDRAAYALDPATPDSFALPKRLIGMGCASAGSAVATRLGPVWLGPDRRMHTVGSPLPSGVGAALAQIPSAHLSRVRSAEGGRYLRVSLPSAEPGIEGECSVLAVLDLQEGRWTTDRYEGLDLAELYLNSAGHLCAWLRDGSRLRLDHPTASADPSGEIVARATFSFPPSLTAGLPAGIAGGLFGSPRGSVGSGSAGSGGFSAYGGFTSGSGGSSLLPDAQVYVGRIGAICDSEATALVHIAASDSDPEPTALEATLTPYIPAWTAASDRVANRHRISLALTATPGSHLLAFFAELTPRPLTPGA